METSLQNISVEKFVTSKGVLYDSIPLSYEVFGLPLFSAPIVLVNHALTGNSTVSGNKGWWQEIVGEDRVIDTNKYTVITFNIPGNGYDGYFIDQPKDFVTKDIARLFLIGLEALNIHKLFTVIGGSLGGAIGWELLALQPDIADHFIPIATDAKTSDWLHSQCMVQDYLLHQEDQPLQKARVHAMLCYRTPDSLNSRFLNEVDDEKNILKSQDWLQYHGEILNRRFTLQAYRLMNHLLMNINPSPKALEKITANLHLVAIDTDLFFAAKEIKDSYKNLRTRKENVFYHEIKSIHGHDAFLMEYQQLKNILQPIFK